MMNDNQTYTNRFRISSQLDSIHLYGVGHGQELNMNPIFMVGNRIILLLTYMRVESRFSPGYKLQRLGRILNDIHQKESTEKSMIV